MGEFGLGFTFYVGNMFGGKTASMIMDLQKAKIAGRNVQAIKVSWDDRYQDGSIVANNGQLTFPAISIPDARFLGGFVRKGIEVLGIDELQFFDERIIDFIREYKDKIKIIGTALQFDYRGNPFSLREVGNKEIDSKYHIGHLMALAYPIIHKLPVCMHTINIEGRRCGKDAQYTQRVDSRGVMSKYNEKTIQVGGANEYFPRCIEHFVKPV